jgi:DNA excision repair protein ERCC-2
LKKIEIFGNKQMNSPATDMAMVISKRFLRSMAQPFEIGQDGISLWGLEDIQRRQAQQRQADAGAMADVNMRSTEADGDEDDEDEDYFGGLEDQVRCSFRPSVSFVVTDLIFAGS